SASITSRSPSRPPRSPSIASLARAAIPPVTSVAATAGSRPPAAAWSTPTSFAASATTPLAIRASPSGAASSVWPCCELEHRTSDSSIRTTCVTWSSSDVACWRAARAETLFTRRRTPRPPAGAPPRGGPRPCQHSATPLAGRRNSVLIKVPVSWLREYVDITVPIDELALKLHMSSTEVKGIERPWWDDKIRTARVQKLAKHPNADKLQLATVDYGAGAPKTVVTGATNLIEGAIVP